MSNCKENKNPGFRTNKHKAQPRLDENSKSQRRMKNYEKHFSYMDGVYVTKQQQQQLYNRNLWIFL